MAHENRTQSDATLVDGYVVPREDFESLDRKQFRSVNGDKGGAWAPLVPITIRGSGLEVTGPALVRGEGVFDVTTYAEITLGDNDFQDLDEGHAGRERVRVVPTVPFLPVGGYPWAIGYSQRHASAQTIALQFKDSLGNISTPEFIVPLSVHHGATLDKIVFAFRVPNLRLAAPIRTPKFRVFRRDKDGNVAYLKLTPTDDGFASPDNPGSAVGWYAEGAAQSFEYACDQNNVIDVGKYVYLAHIVEESGATTYPERLDVFTAVTVEAASTTAISNPTGNTTVDGISMNSSTNARTMLFKDQTNPKANGLWVGPATAPLGDPSTRSPFNDESSDFIDGQIIPIRGGNTQAWTVWQAVVPTPYTINQMNVTYRPPVPRGNIYLPLTLHFSGITSTAWQ